MAEDRNPLADTPEFHMEKAIASTIEAVERLVRGIEILDLDKISSAREKTRDAESSLLAAIRLRGRRGK